MLATILMTGVVGRSQQPLGGEQAGVDEMAVKLDAGGVVGCRAETTCSKTHTLQDPGTQHTLLEVSNSPPGEKKRLS